MFWLKIVRDFIKILREGQTPNQVAGGFALGSLVGFSPALSLQGILIWLVILTLNINLSAAILAFTLFGLAAFLLDPLFHWLGYQILTLDALRDTWTWLYNAPVAPLTRFNNTVVMGSLAGALVLFLPVFFGMKQFVIRYRKHIGAKVEQWKLLKIIKRSTLYQWYEKIRDLRG